MSVTRKDIEDRAESIAARCDSTAAYKGYLIKTNMMGTEFYVSKGGSHIATYSSLAAAKRGIDELTG